jgi:hypothetical protein
MTDPVSLVALGAAVGGLAGKVAEKSWESAEIWLKERFGSHAIEAQARARENAAAFVHDLAARVKALEDRGVLPPNALDAAKHPSVSALLQAAVLGAAQTEDEAKHDLLASVVATRLVSNTESTYALASQMAADAICRVTQRQLQLLGLLCFLEEVRPRQVDTVREYLAWVSAWLSHFDKFEFREIDARHLVAVGCVTFDPASERGLEWIFRIKGGSLAFEAPIETENWFEAMESHWAEGLSGVQLTSVGSIVGGLALGRIVGCDTSTPHWSREGGAS